MNPHVLRRCGRIGRHLAHYWQGPRNFDDRMHRWYKPIYWCGGHVVIEGGHRGVK